MIKNIEDQKGTSNRQTKLSFSTLHTIRINVYGWLGFLKKLTVQAMILSKSSINHWT